MLVWDDLGWFEFPPMIASAICGIYEGMRMSVMQNPSYAHILELLNDIAEP